MTFRWPLHAPFVILWLASSSLAQIPSPEELKSAPESDEAKQLYREIWSPYCPGLPLHECMSTQASALRHEIAEKFREGNSRDAIITDLKDLYGPTVHMLPPKKGFNLSAYVLPFIVLGTALILYLIRVLFSFRKAKHAASKLSQAELSKAQNWLNEEKTST